MSRFLPVVSLVVALAAVGIAVFAPSSSPSATPAQAERTQALPSVERLEALERRLDRTEAEQRTLWSRILVLEQHAGQPTGALPDGGVPIANPVTVAEVAQLKQELHAVMQGDVADPAMRTAFKDLVREVQADLSKERFAERQERQKERAAAVQAKWKSFISDAHLSFQQEQLLTQRLALEDAARQALFAKSEPPQREDMRALRDQRRETDELILPSLDATQQEKYQALRQEENRPQRARPDEGARPAGRSN